MTETAPIACSLDAAAARDRLARIQTIGGRALLAREERGGVHVLRFAADRETRADLAEIVSAERRCCPFLELELGEECGELVLSIGADQEGRGAATMLAEAFGAASRPPRCGRYDAGP
jgi:hypothetical protein